MVRETTSGGHVYTFEGRKYPSVTTILQRTEDKTWLEQWKGNFYHKEFKNADDYTKYTSIRGTLIHFNILNDVAHTILDPSHLPPMSEWWDRREMLIGEVDHAKMLWAKLGLHIRTPIIIETPFFHAAKGYAGTPDMIARIDGVITVVDLKTSRGLRDKHRVQIGGYAQGINAGLPGFVQAGMLVYLHPAMTSALVCKIPARELLEEIDIFNDHLEDFWAIPGIRKEYGL